MLEFRGVVNKNLCLRNNFDLHEGSYPSLSRLRKRTWQLTSALFGPADRLARLLLVQLNGTVAGLVCSLRR